MNMSTLQETWSKRAATACWLQAADELTSEVLAHVKCDACIVDCKHSMAPSADAVRQLQVLQSMGQVTSLVRVPQLSGKAIGSYLDAGFSGVICPMVDTRAQAEALVEACRHAQAALNSGVSLPTCDKTMVNRSSTPIALATIETAQGLANLVEILSTDIDGVFISPMDLNLALCGGKPAREVLAGVAARAEGKGKIAGIYASDSETAEFYISKGFKFVVCAHNTAALPKQGAPVELVEEEKHVNKNIRMDDKTMEENSKKCAPSCEALPNKDKLEIVKAEDMVEKDTALLDSFICGFQRTTTLFFGRIVSNPADLPIFKDWLGYSMTYNNVPSGNGNALHLHNSVEIFVAMDAAFEIGYGPKGENKAVLQPKDFVACPARVYHYYKNVDPSKPANILTILPGRPSVTWAPEVVEKARRKGADCDDTGVLAMKDASMRMDAPKVSEKVFLEGDINPFVMKHANKQAMFLQGPEGWIQLGWKDLRSGESVEITGASPQGPMATVTKEDHDVLVISLSGSVEVTGLQLSESLQRLDMFKLPRKGWAGMFKGITDSTLLIVRSALPQHFDFFFDPDAGTSTTLGRLPSSLMR